MLISKFSTISDRKKWKTKKRRRKGNKKQEFTDIGLAYRGLFSRGLWDRGVDSYRGSIMSDDQVLPKKWRRRHYASLICKLLRQLIKHCFRILPSVLKINQRKEHLFLFPRQVKCLMAGLNQAKCRSIQPPRAPNPIVWTNVSAMHRQTG